MDAGGLTARPAVLEYRTAASQTPAGQRAFLIVCSVFTGLIGVGVIVGLCEWLGTIWPDIGMAIMLVVVPGLLVAGAFLSISVTAARAAAGTLKADSVPKQSRGFVTPRTE